MGLQRNLIIIRNIFSTEALVVKGFNFSLSSDPYKAWYPSLIRRNYGDLYKGIVISNSVHDLVLNLMFTRKFLQASPIHIEGEINHICNRSIIQNLNLFRRIYLRKSNI